MRYVSGRNILMGCCALSLAILGCSKSSSSSVSPILMQGTVNFGGPVSNAAVHAYNLAAATTTGILNVATATVNSPDQTPQVASTNTDGNGAFTLSVPGELANTPLVVEVTVAGLSVPLSVALASVSASTSFVVNALTTAAETQLVQSAAYATILTSADASTVANSVSSLVSQTNGQWSSVFVLSGNLTYPGSDPTNSYLLAQATMEQIVRGGNLSAPINDLLSSGTFSGPTQSQLNAALIAAKTADPSLGSVSITINTSPAAVGIPTCGCAGVISKTSSYKTFVIGLYASGATSIAYQVVDANNNIVVPTTTVSAPGGGAAINLTLPIGASYTLTANGAVGPSNGPPSVTEFTLTTL